MAAASFAQALDAVLRHEGGYVDHPADPGGATNLGITRATLASWRGRAVSRAEVRALGRAETAAIYRALYWDQIRGDSLPAGVDCALFDYAVNSGPGRAVRSLQQLLFVTADGIVGEQTMRSARARDPAELVRGLCAKRMSFLERLRTFSVFGRGWRRRVLETQEHALRIIAKSTSPTGE